MDTNCLAQSDCRVPRLACPTVFSALLDKLAVAPNPTSCACQATGRPACWRRVALLIVLAFTAARTQAAATAPDSPRAMFRMLGVDDAYFAGLTDGTPLDATQRESLLRILFRLRRFPPVDLEHWALDQGQLAEARSRAREGAWHGVSAPWPRDRDRAASADRRSVATVRNGGLLSMPAANGRAVASGRRVYRERAGSMETRGDARRPGRRSACS